MKLGDGPLDNGNDSIPMKPNNTKTTTNHGKEKREDRIECRQRKNLYDHHRRHRPLHSTFLPMVTVVTVTVLVTRHRSFHRHLETVLTWKANVYHETTDRCCFTVTRSYVRTIDRLITHSATTKIVAAAAYPPFTGIEYRFLSHTGAAFFKLIHPSPSHPCNSQLSLGSNGLDTNTMDVSFQPLLNEG